MKTLCVTSDNRLITTLYNTEQFHPIDISIEEHLSDLNFEQYEIILIDGNMIPLSKIENRISQFKNLKLSTSTHFFYLIPNSAEPNVIRQIQFFCMSKDICALLPTLPSEQLAKKILEHLYPQGTTSFSNIICYLGTHPGVGVTTLSLETASKISSISKANVGVLSLNSTNPGDAFIRKYKGVYLDEIKSALGNRLISKEQLYDSMDKMGSFRYLAGNRDIKSRLYFTSDEISYLIEIAKNAFDIIIIDGGCHYDNALTIQALLSSEIKILISCQSNAGFRNWQRAYSQIIEPLGLSENNFLMLINKHKENLNILRTKDIQNMYKIPALHEIPDMGDLGIIAEEDHCLLSDFNIKEYNNAILKLSSNLIKLYNIPIVSEPSDRKGLLNKLLIKYRG